MIKGDKQKSQAQDFQPQISQSHTQKKRKDINKKNVWMKFKWQMSFGLAKGLDPSFTIYSCKICLEQNRVSHHLNLAVLFQLIYQV